MIRYDLIVIGAGAAQTMMNLHGIQPGQKILMLGSGNVGLVVSYQLLQAGCDVVAICDASPKIGGYGVHAAKVARCSVPFYTSHTIIKAEGTDHVTGVTIGEVDFRLWDIDSGEITINNRDIKDYNINSLRDNIFIVTKDVFLFEDSILNNLTYGNKNISEEFVEDICDRVDILNFINKLPNKFNTIINESKLKLTKSQKQRIAIARSLISNSSIIVFDDAMSALDIMSKKNIIENIRDLLQNKTVIVIEYRLSTIKNVDKIYVIDKGRVVEEGNHKELISNQEIYYDLIKEQMNNLALN